MDLFNSVEEKVSYVEALIYISTLDEAISAEEKEYVMEIALRYGIPEEYIDSMWKNITETGDISKALQPIKERRLKLLLVNELIAICYADGRYSDKEQNGMKNICSILGVEEEKLREIEELMIENINLRMKTLKVLELGE